MVNPRTADPRLQRVLASLENDPSQSIANLAAAVQLTPGHLQRLFKEQTNMHIGVYVGAYKLQKAAQLLSDRRLSVKEIAHSIGYNHVSSFVRAFRRRFGCSPKQYRRKRDAIRSIA